MENKPPVEFNLLDALYMIGIAGIDSITSNTISNSFHYAGFSINNETKIIDKIQDHNSDDVTIWDVLFDIEGIPNEIVFNEYIGVDNDLITSHTYSTSDILKQFCIPDIDY